MSLFSRCWHRNFILFAFVLMCLEENVALPASESERNEASTESTKTKRNETTNATAVIPTTLPEDRSFELKQPKQSSGNSRRCCTTLQKQSVLIACAPRGSKFSFNDACECNPWEILRHRCVHSWVFVFSIFRYSQPRMWRNSNSQIHVEWFLYK